MLWKDRERDYNVEACDEQMKTLFVFWKSHTTVVEWRKAWQYVCPLLRAPQYCLSYRWLGGVRMRKSEEMLCKVYRPLLSQVCTIKLNEFSCHRYAPLTHFCRTDRQRNNKCIMKPIILFIYIFELSPSLNFFCVYSYKFLFLIFFDQTRIVKL